MAHTPHLQKLRTYFATLRKPKFLLPPPQGGRNNFYPTFLTSFNTPAPRIASSTTFSFALLIGTNGKRNS